MQREKERDMWVVSVRARGNSKYIERGGGNRGIRSRREREKWERVFRERERGVLGVVRVSVRGDCSRIWRER